MMRSMFAGVSGLRNHQIKMDVIGNNIANVNTVGYKSGRVTFQDSLNQILRGASAPQSGRGGINALQVGLGVNIASIDVLHTQGNLQNTGKISDVAIQGDGFFILGDGDSQFFTRAGNLSLEADGRLVYPSNGLMIQGWMADIAGVINTNSPVTGIQLPIGQNISPSATTAVGFKGNFAASTCGELKYNESTIDVGSNRSVTISYVLTPTSTYNQFEYTISTNNGTISGGGSGTITLDDDGNVVSATPVTPFTITGTGGDDITLTPPAAGAANGGSFSAVVNSTPPVTHTIAGEFTPPLPLTTQTKVYDSLGQEHIFTTIATKTAVNTWNWETTSETGDVLGGGTLLFNSAGKLISASGGTITYTPTGADPMTITPDFSNISQFDSPASTFSSPDQNGFSMGQLESFNIDKGGKIIGVFSNGRSQVLAQIAVANFNNPSGLLRSGESMFAASANSGTAQIGMAGSNGRGYITPAALEMSNVDLSQEFTDMIVTQRGFQANSRIITTSDEMLQELVGLKR